MTEPSSVQDAWSWASARPADGALRAIHFRNSSDSIWAAITPSGEYCVLIEMRPDESMSDLIRVVSNSKVALRAEHYPFRDGEREIRGVLIVCALSELKEAFAAFCTLFVDRCQRNEPKAKAFLFCLADFKRLVSNLDTTGSPALLTGLIGELLTLRELTSATDLALPCWAYPELARHDFRRGGVALEVKTSLRSRQSKAEITVHSIDQLEAPENGLLFLTWFLLEGDPQGGLSINSLSDTISALLDGVHLQDFRSRVSQFPLDAESRGRSFTLLERREFAVKEDFPRLVRPRLRHGALDSGVSGVTYSLDLSSAEGFRCSAGSAITALTSGHLAI